MRAYQERTDNIFGIVNDIVNQAMGVLGQWAVDKARVAAEGRAPVRYASPEEVDAAARGMEADIAAAAAQNSSSAE